jgi:hypothetical protein
MQLNLPYFVYFVFTRTLTVSYVHLINFQNDPEKELKESLKNQGQISLFPT